MNRHHIRAVLFGAGLPGRCEASTRFLDDLGQQGVRTADGCDPEGRPAFATVAERLGIPAFHCLALAGSDAEVAAARAAGMKCVGVAGRAGLSEAPAVVEGVGEIDVGAMLDSGRPYRPQPHGWLLEEGPFRPVRALYWESLFAVGNGVIGVRGNLEEEAHAGESYPATFLNGVVGYYPYSYMWAFPGYPHRGHGMPNICEWTRLRLEAEGEVLAVDGPGVVSHRRWLDLQAGILHRETRWKTPVGTTVTLRTRRMASMQRRHAAHCSYEVEADAPCAVRLVSATEFSPHSRHFNRQEMARHRLAVREGGVLVAEMESATSGQRVAAGLRHRVCGEGAAPEVSVGETGGNAVVRAEVRPGRPLVFEKSAVFYCDLEAADPAAERDRELAGLPEGEVLFAEQAAWWGRYWDLADVEIEGDPLAQLGLRLSLFHNRQSIPEDGFRSVGANGLTGDNYAGHVFWDTEQYIAVPLLHTEPHSVRGLLEYRHRILDKARERAHLMQGKGAEYSWNSITGEECGHVFEAAQGQIHLQSDIPWAIDRYVRASGDTAFLHGPGAEIFFETARYLFDRGAFSPHKGGHFVFNAVCGPNEYGCGVDNNAYTNYLAQWHFARAAELYREMAAEAPEALAALRERTGVAGEEAEDWRRAAERMYLPYDETLGLVPQDDNFLGRDPVDMSQVPLHTDMRISTHPLNLWRRQWIKQADAVLLMFLLRHRFDDETVRRTYEYHEPKTNHGSSLSACMHCIVAADIGKMGDALHFFRESALMDINDLKGNTGGGMHSACLGGTWMAAVHGFGGMRDGPEGLSFRPRLPEGWTRLAFQIVWRGSRLAVELSHTGARYRHCGGPALGFRHGGLPVQLAAGGERIFA